MTKFWSKYKDEYRKLLMLGAPILVTQLSVILFAFSDTLMVGRYSVHSLAASAFVNALYLVPNVMLMGMAGGVTPLVGALFARKEQRDAGHVVRAAVRVNVIAALLFTFVMGVLYFHLDRFGQDPELLPEIRSYYITMLFTPLLVTLFNVPCQMCNAIEDTRMPMFVTVLSIGINILFNWLLIYGVGPFPEWGLFGAGVATVFGRLIGVVAIWGIILMLKRYRTYRTGLYDGRRLGADTRLVWNTSWPLMLQSGSECALWSFGGVVCGWFGAVQLAAYQVVNTIGQLGFMIYISFTSAVTIRVAFYAGHRDEQGAGAVARAGLHINLILATLASILFIFAGRWLIQLFVHTDPGAVDGMAVVASGSLLIIPLVVYQYFDATQLTMCNAIRGTGQVKPLFWISLFSYIILGVPLLLLFAKVFGMGNVGAYWSFDIVLAAACVMAVVVFRRIRFN